MATTRKSNKPDKSLFQGFNEAKTPKQKVVPVKEDSGDGGEKLKPLHLMVTQEQKKRYNLFRAAKDMKLRDFIITAIDEYIERHPLA